MNSIVAKGLMVVGRPLKREEPPSWGYGLFYTCAPEQIWRIFYVILIANKSYARQWNVEHTLKIGIFLFMILLSRST